MDAELKKLLKQSITINAYASRNDDNEFTYSATSVVVACRIQHKIKVIQDVNGRDVVSAHQIYVDGAAVVTVNDKITLTDGTTPKILNIYSDPDETGLTYYRCIYT